jgi:hypothetical protein
MDRIPMVAQADAICPCVVMVTGFAGEEPDIAATSTAAARLTSQTSITVRRITKYTSSTV